MSRLGVPSEWTITGHFLFKKNPGSDWNSKAARACSSLGIFTALYRSRTSLPLPPVWSGAVMLLWAPPPGGGRWRQQSQLPTVSALRTWAGHLLVSWCFCQRHRGHWAGSLAIRTGWVEQPHLFLIRATNLFWSAALADALQRGGGSYSHHPWVHNSPGGR